MLGTQDETTSIHAISKLPTWRLPQSSRLTSLCREEACCLQRNSSEGEVRCMTHRQMDAIKGAAAKPVRHTGSVWGLRVSGSRKGVSGSRGVFFPEWCFRFPGGFGGSQGVFSSRAGVFSVPRFGFDVSGMVCWAPVGVFSSRNGVSGSRPEGTAWRCLWFPYGVSGSHACSSPSSLLLLASSCFFLLLCFLLLPCFLPSFHLSSFPPLLPCFLSFFFPFLRSCLLPSFPALLLPFL